MKKIVFLIVFFTFGVLFLTTYNNISNEIIIDNVSKKNTNSNKLAVMYENSYNSGEYSQDNSNNFGKPGYIFNTKLSKCVNGSEILYDNASGKVFVYSIQKDKCYVYFDKLGNYFYKQILKDNGIIKTRTDFSAPFVEENSGVLYIADGKYTEDIDKDGVGEKTYYFSGNAKNNWVKFGKNEKNEDLYWRIIRINEDNGVRLLYVGNSINSTTAYITTSAFVDYIYGKTADEKYSGYMYGNSGKLDDYRLNTNDSTIKVKIDNWYENSLILKRDINNYLYNDYISKTAIYCNDRSTVANISYWFATYDRLETPDIHPSFRCGASYNGNLQNNASDADKFSASISIGNGKLKYPISLMTADEVAYAGGIAGNSLGSPYAYYYLNGNNESVTGTLAWWTLSPNQTYGSNVQNYIISGSGNPGYIGNVYNNKVYGVRPVLSIKSCAYYSSGNGSIANPYEVFIDGECSKKDN